MEDPFFVVKDEVQKAVSSCQALYDRWQDLLNNPNAVGKEEFNWTSNEIKNSVRSIEWDLEDLEETIGIVESNPQKFKLNGGEVNNRKQFIRDTRRRISQIKDHVHSPDTKVKIENGTRQALMGVSSKTSGKFSRLDNEMERSNQRFIEETQQQQQMLMEQQNDDLEKVGQSVGVLKHMGQRIETELDEQNVLLDDLGNEIETTDSKLQTVLVRVEKVLRLADDKKQTYVLIALILMMVIVVILFITL